ncbi:XRE family transcriptional regulator [Pseudomonas sp. Hp2]|nr:S24 family peptidase [Pseudomonas sp. Hp2]
MPETFKERMKRIRLRAGFKSQRTAADAIGCDRGNVGMWEAPSSAVQSVGQEWLFEVARAYQVRPQWINDLSSSHDGYPWTPDEGERIRVHAYQIRAVDGEDGLDPATDVSIPVYDIEVSGGPGTIIPEYVETRYRLPYQIDWLNRWEAKPESILIAKVRGSSMEPVLYNGDKVVIHTGRRRVIDDCVYSLIYAGEARVKRLFKLPGGGLRIVSSNPDKARYPDEIVQADELEAVYIIGQVIDKMGSGGLGF